MANAPIEPIVINDPEFGTIAWTPGEHAQGHLANLSPEEQEVITEEVAKMAPDHARQLTATVCILSGVLKDMKSMGASLEKIRHVVSVPPIVINVDLGLDRFQGPGPTFWDPPIPPKRRRSWLEDLFGGW